MYFYWIYSCFLYIMGKNAKDILPIYRIHKWGIKKVLTKVILIKKKKVNCVFFNKPEEEKENKQNQLNWVLQEENKCLLSKQEI